MYYRRIVFFLFCSFFTSVLFFDFGKEVEDKANNVRNGCLDNRRKSAPLHPEDGAKANHRDLLIVRAREHILELSPCGKHKLRGACSLQNTESELCIVVETVSNKLYQENLVDAGVCRAESGNRELQDLRDEDISALALAVVEDRLCQLTCLQRLQLVCVVVADDGSAHGIDHLHVGGVREEDVRAKADKVVERREQVRHVL